MISAILYSKFSEPSLRLLTLIDELPLEIKQKIDPIYVNIDSQDIRHIISNSNIVNIRLVPSVLKIHPSGKIETLEGSDCFKWLETLYSPQKEAKEEQIKMIEELQNKILKLEEQSQKNPFLQAQQQAQQHLTTVQSPQAVQQQASMNTSMNTPMNTPINTPLNTSGAFTPIVAEYPTLNENGTMTSVPMQPVSANEIKHNNLHSKKDEMMAEYNMFLESTDPRAQRPVV
jgi:hypothetical protein